MAIDPRISLAVQVPDTSRAINTFNNAMINADNRSLAQAQEQRRQELQPFNLQQAQQGVDINQQTLDQNRNVQRLTNLHQTGQLLKPFLESGDVAGAQKFMLDNIARVQSRISQGSGEDITESMETLAQLQSGDVQGVLGNINAVAGLVAGNDGKSLGQKDFENKVNLVKNDPELLTVEGQAAAIDLGLRAKKSSAAAIEIANDPTLASAVASTSAQIEGAKESAKEGAKLTQQLKHKPKITRAIKLAEAAAKEQGEVLTDLDRAVAGMPGLIEATDNLKELAAIATSTFGGRVFDLAAKESGWGSTKGSNAKIKYKAIIDNQVLPLLKQTFGGAMTEGEGLRLSNTLGDPNASPEQKLLQTEAFMEHQIRQMETLKRQADAGTIQGERTPNVLNFDEQGNLIQ